MNSSIKDAVFVVGGIHGNPAVPQKRVSVLAIVSCYNDEDFIINTAEHLIKEGVSVYFVDNWSTDKTWEIISELHRIAPENIVGVERFPAEGPSPAYCWEDILERKEALSRLLPFDWFVHYDSDELRTSPWPDLTLAQAINAIDAMGYNAIDHTVVDFRPTQDGFCASSEINDYFTHFEFGSDYSSFNQIKGWAAQPGPVHLAQEGGHRVKFPNRRVFPLKFTLNHFSIRSKHHAEKKLFSDRLPRIAKEQKEKGWHIQYGRFVSVIAQDFIWNPSELISYDPTMFPKTYLCERLSGIGLKTKINV